MEQVVTSQLNENVPFNGLKIINKSVYNHGHSTETASMLIKNEIHQTLAGSEDTAVELLDQSYHGTLLDCLSSWLGVSASRLVFILSDTKKFLYGVSQGSFLDPVQFSLYTTPISKLI